MRPIPAGCRSGGLMLVLLAIMGCSTAIDSKPVRALEADEFVRVDGESKSSFPLDAAAEAAGPIETVREVETVEIDGRSYTEATEEVIGPDGLDEEDLSIAVDVPVGVPYPIESLVGQINGRPVYAEEFLFPLEDRILRIVAESPLPDAIRSVDALVVQRFREFVDSELIIAEAESKLDSQQQQGVLAWLKSVQEDTIADRGGTRDTASASIEEEFGVSFDEFMVQRRSIALASDLLRKRVQPRAIVSWRDIEQAYRRNYATFNPPPTLRIGRIRFSTKREAEKVEQAKALIAGGADFAAVCAAMEIPDDGAWLDLELPSDGIAGTTLTKAVKSRLEGLETGELSEPWVQTAFISWFAVTGIEKQPGRSIYDPSVQFGLEGELSNMRMVQEQDRYLSTLKDRWVSGDIDEMRRRLLTIARLRYFSK
ncbi:MAG: hypothetical protein GY885_12800 [Phycisphaeraceae bacterium]|nr:hypothetical protein [Phycisphaeraceae bacterium]